MEFSIRQTMVKATATSGSQGEPEDMWLVDSRNALGTVGQTVQVVEEQPDDLTEPERDDGEIIAAEPQHGNAQKHAGDAGERAANDQHEAKRQMDVELAACQDRVAVGADGVERHEAEIE